MRNLFVLAICTCFTLLLFLTPCQGADRYPIQINFNKNTAAVKVFKRDKKAHVKLKRMTQEDVNFVRLTVDPATPTPAAITRELNLIPGKNNILRISMTCRTHNLERGHAKMIVYAFGGKLPGNRVWHLTAMPLDTSDWVTATTDLTLPQDSSKLHVRLLLSGGSGVLDLKNITIKALKHTSQSIQAIDLNFPTDQSQYRTFSPLLLGMNMVFTLPGAYHGTLPTDNPKSHRPEFIKHLKQAGIRTIRFPGGTPSHWYPAGYPKQNHELLVIKDQHNKQQHHSTYPHGHVPQWLDVHDTLKEAHIKIIYQLNTSTFVDDQGNIKPVLENKFTRRLGIADGKDHLEEATAALTRDFEKGIFAKGQVDVWELGNEEHAKMTAQQYASIANAYTRILMKYDPNTPVCISGNWHKKVLLHVDKDVVKHLTATTSHYPFSQWPRPNPIQATSDLKQMAQGHVGMPKNCQHYAQQVALGSYPKHMKLAVTETGIYKYFAYDPFKVTASYAHALCFAGNWPELISEPIVNMAVLHDLESPFFGSLMYNVKFKPNLRQFDWIDLNEVPPVKNNKPMPGAELKKTFYFPNTYVPMSITRVTAMLSQMVGSKITRAPSNNARQLTGNLIGLKDNKVYLFICNPTHLSNLPPKMYWLTIVL